MTPTLKYNQAAGYQGPVIRELLKDAGLLPGADPGNKCDRFPIMWETNSKARGFTDVVRERAPLGNSYIRTPESTIFSVFKIIPEAFSIL